MRSRSGAGRGGHRGRAAAMARAQAMVAGAAELFFTRTAGPAFGFSFQIDGDVPPARGLGSSVTVRAGVHPPGWPALAGAPMNRHDIIALVTELEGHPDNASAGVLGGSVSRAAIRSPGAYVRHGAVEVPAELAFVVVSPQIEILRRVARDAPGDAAVFDAVRSIQRDLPRGGARARDYAKLRHAVRDYMHEPYRLRGSRAPQAIDAGVAPVRLPVAERQRLQRACLGRVRRRRACRRR